MNSEQHLNIFGILSNPLADIQTCDCMAANICMPSNSSAFVLTCSTADH